MEGRGRGREPGTEPWQWTPGGSEAAWATQLAPAAFEMEEGPRAEGCGRPLELDKARRPSERNAALTTAQFSAGRPHQTSELWHCKAVLCFLSHEVLGNLSQQLWKINMKTHAFSWGTHSSDI